MALKRLQYEFKKLSQEPSSSPIRAGPIDESDIYHWWATIEGPPGTPFEGGVFRIFIEYPTEYPFKSPKMRFETKIFHPNICRCGTVCVDTLRKHWSPVLTTRNVLLSICSLLASPDLDHPIDAKSAIMYRENPMLYSKKAKRWTEMYAISRVPPLREEVGIGDAQSEIVTDQPEPFSLFCVPVEYLTPAFEMAGGILSLIFGYTD